MNNNTIRIVVILALLSIIGISITQYIWFRKAFDLRENQFNYNVTIALKNVSENITRYNNSPPLSTNPVNQLAGNYFVVRVNDAIDANLLEQLLVNQFRDRSIENNFEYGIYDCTYEKMVYGNYVSMNDRQARSKQGELPRWEDDSYYFGVFFPEKGLYLLGQMNIWLFSTAVLLFVILFFSYTLFVILRQKRLSEIQKDFINNMTHEFKTPISTISISAEVLKTAGIETKPDRLRQYAGIIHDESSRLKNQVERILQIARSEFNKMEYTREELDVHQLLKDSVALLEPKFMDLNGKIELALEASESAIMGDALHLSNSFFNLIDNALKYSGKEPDLEIRTQNSGRFIFIIFQDHGIGIEKKYHKKIFDKFFRVPTGDIHDARGFGLGLNYVHKIVRLHGGRVNLQSKPGKGSIFELKIPINNG